MKIDGITYEITAEMNLKKIITELKEVAQSLNEFVDNLEQIEKKYERPQAEMEGKNVFERHIESGIMTPYTDQNKGEENESRSRSENKNT